MPVFLILYRDLLVYMIITLLEFLFESDESHGSSSLTIWNNELFACMSKYFRILHAEVKHELSSLAFDVVASVAHSLKKSI